MKNTSLAHRETLIKAALLALSICVFAATRVQAQTTEFVYQGQLQNGGSPAAGNYDFEFLLYDALSGGAQVGVTLTKSSVPVASGIFSTKLDFGSNFPGAARFIEIHVRASGGGSFTLLTPRQSVSSTPYSIKSIRADDSSQLNGQAPQFYQNADNLASGTVNAARFPVPLTLSGTGNTIISASNSATSFNSYAVYGAATALSGPTTGVGGVSASDNGTGVYGFVSSNTGATKGVLGVNFSTSGTGVYGSANSTTGYTYGVLGETFSSNGTGVAAIAHATSGLTYGVFADNASTNGPGVYGRNSATTGSTFGVWGDSASTAGTGVYGRNTSGTGINYGVSGENASTSGIGVYGVETSGSGTTSGVYGLSNSTSGRGVFGIASANSGTTYGVYGQSNSTSGFGVYGIATAGTGQGVRGDSTSTSGIGLIGVVSSVSGQTKGVWGDTSSTSGIGVYGLSRSTTGTTQGVWGESSSTGGTGVYGINTAGAGSGLGVRGDTSSGTGVFGFAGSSSGQGRGMWGESASPDGIGVYGRNTSVNGPNAGSVGVWGETSGQFGYGVYGLATNTGNSSMTYGVFGSALGNNSFGSGVYGIGNHYGVYGSSNNVGAYGGFFQGNLGASGLKSFRIDHPDDPANKYLLHYSSESPEVINFYRGTIVLDSEGEAVVELPGYFAKINKDPSYTLTAVGAAMPNLHIAVEIDAAALKAGEKAGANEAARKCYFRIAGGVAGAKVSWRVEAVRNDLYVRTKGAAVEIQKEGTEKGTYQHPDLYGQPAAKSMNYLPTPKRPEPIVPAPVPAPAARPDHN